MRKINRYEKFNVIGRREAGDRVAMFNDQLSVISIPASLSTAGWPGGTKPYMV